MNENNTKEAYVAPELEIIEFETDDIITESNPDDKPIGDELPGY